MRAGERRTCSRQHRTDRSGTEHSDSVSAVRRRAARDGPIERMDPLGRSGAARPVRPEAARRAVTPPPGTAHAPRYGEDRMPWDHRPVRVSTIDVSATREKSGRRRLEVQDSMNGRTSFRVVGIELNAGLVQFTWRAGIPERRGSLGGPAALQGRPGGEYDAGQSPDSSHGLAALFRRRRSAGCVAAWTTLMRPIATCV